MFEWYVFSYGSKRWYKRKNVSKRDWTTCSKHVNNGLNSITNIIKEGGGERGLYDHLMSTRISI